MRTAIALFLIIVAGCALGSHANPDLAGTSDASPSGAPPPTDDCGAVGLSSPPGSPVAGPGTKVRVLASVTVTPPPTASWRVRFRGAEIASTAVRPDGLEIEFSALEAGIYTASVALSGPRAACGSAALTVNVAMAGAKPSAIRLRIVPRQSTMMPPFEKTTVILGGAAMDLGSLRGDSSSLEQLRVDGPDGGVPAYLRFVPNAAPGAVVEAFSDSTGQLAVPLAVQLYGVVVIPSVAGLAPRRITDWMPASSLPLTVDAGSLITGTVRDPDGAPVVGAVVRLSTDGVPSTVATTDGAGSFALRATIGSGAVTVEVTPAATSSLPRLSATSQGFDLGVPLQIRYTVKLRNLAGMQLQQATAPLANATLMVVGSAAVGTVSAGILVTAAGNVRIAATANASGVLPSLQVPPAPLSGVITTATGDLAVVALDATGAVAVLDVPPVQPISTAVLGATGTDALTDAVIDLVPLGALASAGVPELHVTAGMSGLIRLALAPGGHYDLRLHAGAGRGAPLFVADRDASSIAPTYRLPAALELSGRVNSGSGQALSNASVQLLCISCTGLDRERPIAETATDNAGSFVLSVPDPGTM